MPVLTATVDRTYAAESMSRRVGQRLIEHILLTKPNIAPESPRCGGGVGCFGIDYITLGANPTTHKDITNSSAFFCNSPFRLRNLMVVVCGLLRRLFFVGSFLLNAKQPFVHKYHKLLNVIIVHD